MSSNTLKIRFVAADGTENNGSATELTKAPGLTLLGRLWLGDRDSASYLQLRHRKITHVINCERDIHGSSKEEGVTYLLIDPEADEGKCFEAALAFLDKHCGSGSANVLVHCMTGNGRSAGILLYYLMKKLSMTFANSHRALKALKPAIAPRADLVRLLLAEERALYRGLETIGLNEKRQIIYKDGDDMFSDMGANKKNDGKKKQGGYGGIIGLVVVVFFGALYFGLSMLTAPKQPMAPPIKTANRPSSSSKSRGRGRSRSGR